MKHSQTARNHSVKTALRLMGYVAGTFRLQFAAVFITIIISALASTAGPLFLMYLIDDFVTPLLGMQNPDFSGMFAAVLSLGGLYYVGVLCTYIYNRLMVNIGQGVLKRVRDEMFVHMQTLPIGFFDRHTHGELMSLYTNDTDTLRQMISQSIPQVFSCVVTVLAMFIAMLRLSLPLSVLAVLLIGVMIFLTKLIGGKSGTYFVAQQNELGRVNGYIEELMGGQKVVKVFCHEDEVKAGFDALNQALCDSATKANQYANIMMPVMGNLGNLHYVLTAILGAILTLGSAGGLTLGAMASFLQFTRSFSQPFSQIAQQTNSIVMALAGAERIFSFLDEMPETDDGDVTLVNAGVSSSGVISPFAERTGTWAWRCPRPDGEDTYLPLLGDVRFQNMNFGYQAGEPVLHDLTLYAKPGQKLAFVGSTGAGKTTITNLINRFYDVQGGEITYDGISVNQIKKADLRRSLGVVLQDTHLFTDTILENIRYGRLEATDVEVEAAAKLANADAFIRLLPKGYDTVLTGDGEGLSQGQRQLLSIARAAVADPPVLILDEATSSIDTRTEALVQAGMDALMQGRTVFVIAHRLSTIRNADVILVLEQGRIAERGTHDELLAQHGIYYQLNMGVVELS